MGVHPASGDIRSGPGMTASTSAHKSRLGSAPNDTPASPWLWPSRTPTDLSQRESARKSPSLASLPKPSISLQDSRDRGDYTSVIMHAKLEACCTDVAAYFPGCLERCDKQWEAFRHIAPGPYRRLNKNSFLLRGLKSPWHDAP